MSNTRGILERARSLYHLPLFLVPLHFIFLSFLLDHGLFVPWLHSVPCSKTLHRQGTWFLDLRPVVTSQRSKLNWERGTSLLGVKKELCRISSKL